MIVNITRQITLATRVKTALTPWSRMKGLLGAKTFDVGQALVIPHCQSIHMLFMAFPIDVIFCDAKGKVIGLCPVIKPFCFSPLFFKASYAIELPGGTIASSKTMLGDLIQK